MNAQAHLELMSLLAIAGPPAQERRVAEYLQQTLVAMGVSPESITTDQAQMQSEYGGDTGNLIVRLDGHGRGPRRLFSAHMDTVPGAVGAIPRLDEAKRRIVNDAAGKALGGDNRTGCAALLEVARALCQRNGDHAPTTLVFFIQEEVGLVGARGLDVSLLGSPAPTMGFNFDGFRADEIITSVIGTERFTIDIRGIPAHGGVNPQEGLSTAMIAAAALAQLNGDGWHGLIEKPAGRGTANVGIIRGGTGSNVVMPELHILAEARAHDPNFRRQIIRAWREAFEQSVASHANHAGRRGEVKFGPGPTYEAFALADDAPVVQAARQAAQQCGASVHCANNDGGLDANWMVAHGIPTVTFGLGQQNVHTPEETIDLEQFDLACLLAVQIATN